MYASSIPTRFEPAKPPSRPNIKIKADAIPRNSVGNKFTETAIIMPAQLQQLRNTAKLNTIALNSVKKFKATHVIADIINQMPKMERIIWSFINLQCINSKHNIVQMIILCGNLFSNELATMLDIRKNMLTASNISYDNIFLLSKLAHLKNDTGSLVSHTKIIINIENFKPHPE